MVKVLCYKSESRWFDSCGVTDALLHRLIDCEKGPVIWNWTKTRIAAILRIHPKHIPGEWTLRPTFRHWPTQKQAAIIWIMVHLILYRLQTQRRLSLADYMDFLKRARWKEYHRATQTPTVGRYLDVPKRPPPICTRFVTARYKSDYYAPVRLWKANTSLPLKDSPRLAVTLCRL